MATSQGPNVPQEATTAVLGENCGAVVPPTGRFGRYQIMERIGAGGMGTVFQAYDPQLDRMVALKAPLLTRDGSPSPNTLQRFLREARAAAKVEHRHVCTIYDAGEEQGKPFVVMALLPGPSLQELVKKGVLEPRRAAALVAKVASALQAVHGQGIIHRDIKPGNILLDADHEPMLTDFGLAHASDGRDGQPVTLEGDLIGTPAFMAPEQARGEAATPASDIYSLGVVLYELVAGRSPFQGEVLQVLAKVAHEVPLPPSRHCPDLDRGLEAIILKAMAQRPEDRYATPLAFAQALTIWQRTPATEAPPTAPAATPSPLAFLDSHATQATPSLAVVQSTLPSARRPGRRWLVAASMLLLAVVAVVYLGPVVLSTGKPDDEPPKPLAPTTVKPKAPEKSSPPMDDAWMQHVARLSAKAQVDAVAKKLQELNPHFDGNVTPTIDGDRVTGLAFLSDEVTNVAPVRALAGLKVLKCNGSGLGEGKLKNLGPLKGLRLESLNIDFTRVADLEPLSSMPMRYVSAVHSGVADLSPLRGAPLEMFTCNGSPVFDLSPLSEATGLTSLGVWGTKVVDLSPVKAMKGLRILIIGSTRVRSLEPVRGLPLIYVDAWNTPVTDFSPLAGMSLQRVEGGNPWRDAEILRPMRSLKEIVRIPVGQYWKSHDDFIAWSADVAGQSASSQVDAVEAELRKRNPAFQGKLQAVVEGDVVREVRLPTDEFADLSPLRAFPRLAKLVLAPAKPAKANPADLWPLRGMPLTHLDCTFTPLSDLGPIAHLPKLSELRIRYTSLPDLAPLRKTTVEKLEADIDLPGDAETLRAMPKLATINGRPKDEFLKKTAAFSR